MGRDDNVRERNGETFGYSLQGRSRSRVGSHPSRTRHWESESLAPHLRGRAHLQECNPDDEKGRESDREVLVDLCRISSRRVSRDSGCRASGCQTYTPSQVRTAGRFTCPHPFQRFSDPSFRPDSTSPFHPPAYSFAILKLRFGCRIAGSSSSE